MKNVNDFAPGYERMGFYANTTVLVAGSDSIEQVASDELRELACSFASSRNVVLIAALRALKKMNTHDAVALVEEVADELAGAL